MSTEEKQQQQNLQFFFSTHTEKKTKKKHASVNPEGASVNPEGDISTNPKKISPKHPPQRRYHLQRQLLHHIQRRNFPKHHPKEEDQPQRQFHQETSKLISPNFCLQKQVSDLLSKCLRRKKQNWMEE